MDTLIIISVNHITSWSMLRNNWKWKFTNQTSGKWIKSNFHKRFKSKTALEWKKMIITIFKAYLELEWRIQEKLFPFCSPKSWSCFLSRYFSGECRQLHNIVTGVAVIRVRGVNCERVRLQLMITWEDTDHWSLVTHMTLWHTPLQHCSRDDCRTFY